MFGNLFDRLACRRGGTEEDRPPRLLEAWMPRPAMDFIGDVAYGRHPRQRLDLYLPHDPGARRRLVVFVYGGAWNAGTRRTYRFVAHMLVACGFAVAVPDYRLYPEARFPDFIEDTAMALGWLRRHGADHGTDPRRLALIGHSAGAYNAAMVALDPGYLERAGTSPGIVRGVVGLAGPYAFNPLDYEETREIFAPSRHAPERAKPIALVRDQAPPMLLAHGLIDRRVLPLHSERFAAALKTRGNEAVLRLYPRHGHVGLLLALANPFQRLFRVLGDTVGFLDGALGRAG